MRVTGFSGFDVDSMVTSMMTVSKAPLDKLTQQKQILNWQRDSYREVNSKLFNFKNTKLVDFNKSTELNAQKAVVTGNTVSVKAEASADAQNIPMTVSVKKLATPASHESKGSLSGFKGTSTLAEIAKGAEGSTEGKFAISINGEKFSFDATTTISKVVSTINANPAAKAKASFDEITGNFKVSSTTYGKSSAITVEDVKNETEPNQPESKSLMSLFGGMSSNDGEDAKLIINDKNMTSESNSLKINGVVLTFLSTTGIPNKEAKETEQNLDTNPVKIAFQTNTEKALSTVKSFIEEYNTLISYINTVAGEERYRDYAPLTDEQKKEMTDKDIELWEAKAKSGLLKNDEILKSTASSMRSIITGKLSALSSLGITTGQYYENGKLYLDEDKFEQAMRSNPQQLIDVFQGVGSSTGIFSKMSETINGSLDKLVNKAGTSKFSGDLNSIFKEESIMGRQLKDYNKRIEALQLKLTNLETRYYKQFTAMETAMNKYNSQSSSLSSYLS